MVADAGRAPCWCAVSADGGTLYVANTANDAIGVYSLADPLHPAQVPEFDLTARGSRTATRRPTPTCSNRAGPVGRAAVRGHPVPPTNVPAGEPVPHSVGRGGRAAVGAATPIVFRQSDVPAIAHPQGVEAVGGRVDVAPPAAAGRLAGRSLVAPPPALTSASRAGRRPPAASPPPPAGERAGPGGRFAGCDRDRVQPWDWDHGIGGGTYRPASPAPGDLTVGL